MNNFFKHKKSEPTWCLICRCWAMNPVTQASSIQRNLTHCAALAIMGILSDVRVFPLTWRCPWRCLDWWSKGSRCRSLGTCRLLTRADPSWDSELICWNLIFSLATYLVRHGPLAIPTNWHFMPDAETHQKHESQHEPLLDGKFDHWLKALTGYVW